MNVQQQPFKKSSSKKNIILSSDGEANPGEEETEDPMSEEEPDFMVPSRPGKDATGNSLFLTR